MHALHHKTNKILCFEFLCQINTGQADGTPGLDLNVAEAWELGYTGKGVTIGIMDDGECFTAFTSFGSKFAFPAFRTGKINCFGDADQRQDISTPSSGSMVIKLPNALNKYLLELANKNLTNK
jgi:hypothetical protein